MSAATEERWRKAIAKQLDNVANAKHAVDAACPRTRYSWWRRLWWRVVGTPADVRAREYLESRRRAELLMRELHEHRGEREA